MRSLKAIVLSFVLCLNGCLTSPNPFFASDDIIQDSNLVGSFYDRQEEITWTVSPSGEEKGRYDVQLQDHEATSHFRGTLFRIDDVTYLNMASIGEIAVHVDRSPSGEVPTVSQRMKQFFRNGRHLVFRVSMTATETTILGTFPTSLAVCRKKVGPPPLKRTSYAVYLDRPTKELREILRKYGTGKILFTEKKVFQKKTANQSSTAQRP